VVLSDIRNLDRGNAWGRTAQCCILGANWGLHKKAADSQEYETKSLRRASNSYRISGVLPVAARHSTVFTAQ
jgi:hypothetical protein